MRATAPQPRSLQAESLSRERAQAPPETPAQPAPIAARNRSTSADVSRRSHAAVHSILPSWLACYAACLAMRTKSRTRNAAAAARGKCRARRQSADNRYRDKRRASSRRHRPRASQCVVSYSAFSLLCQVGIVGRRFGFEPARASNSRMRQKQSACQFTSKAAHERWQTPSKPTTSPTRYAANADHA